MAGGYVRLHRKALKSGVFKNAELWKVWTWCIMKASHKDRLVPVRTGRGMTQVEIKRGQFIYGRHIASTELDTSGTSIQGRMKKLENAGNIVIQPFTHYSVVTVVNFELYNAHPHSKVRDNADSSSTNPSTNRQPTVNQPVTDKNVFKNVREGKEKKEAQAPLFPGVLETDEFREAWADWQQHRREIKKPLTPASIKQQLAKLESWGVDRAVDALRHSIANSWTGIFEPDTQTRRTGGKQGFDINSLFKD